MVIFLCGFMGSGKSIIGKDLSKLYNILSDDGLFICNFFGEQTLDELKYSFIARKQDGTECLIEGTMLGGGIHSSSNPPQYTGTMSNCSDKDLPFE